MAHESAARLRLALSGAAVRPPVAGLTFVSPDLLAVRGGSKATPAISLARACAGLGLDFAFVPSWESWATAAVRELDAAGVASLWVVPGVLWPALEVLGTAAGLRFAARRSRQFETALDAVTDEARTAVVEGLDLGVGGFVVADDLAGAAGPIVAPEFLRESVFPRIATIVAAAVRDADTPLLMHCDGAAEVLYGDMRAAGFAGVHGDCGGSGRIETALTAARAEGLVLVGGLGVADLTGAVRGAAAGTRAAALAGDGGFVIADDGGVATREGYVALAAALGAVGQSRGDRYTCPYE